MVIRTNLQYIYGTVSGIIADSKILHVLYTLKKLRLKTIPIKIKNEFSHNIVLNFIPFILFLTNFYILDTVIKCVSNQHAKTHTHACQKNTTRKRVKITCLRVKFTSMRVDFY
jgi:uncharacterized membrane protein YcgQ (UPF0703/DUF1980 family)